MAHMDSNFSHLADVDRQLVRLGELAERLFHIDPPSCIGKTRSLAELLAKEVAARGGLQFDSQTTFEELLRRLRDDGLLPREVSELFH
jgi:type I restriction enzyme R subunit